MDKLTELSWLFLKLGTTAFGGPAAHIAMMHDEIVRKRRWLTERDFLDLVSAANLIPGPNSTELAIHIGYRQAGMSGLLAAGLCFITPAVLIVTAIAMIYTRYHQLPQLRAVMLGIEPVVVAIILQALLLLGRSVLKTWPLKLLAVLSLAGCICGLNEITVLLLTGLSAALARCYSGGAKPGWLSMTFMALIFAVCVILVAIDLILVAPVTGYYLVPVIDTSYSNTNLFWYFARVGSMLYGSGYVLLAFLQKDLVNAMHWLNTTQLMDATAIGQVTPGPVFTTATFVGYILGGTCGAAAATTGIFLPAFGFVALTAPFIHKLRQSPLLSAWLDGFNVASLALMIWVLIHLARLSLQSNLSVIIFAISLILLLWRRINTTWLIAGGALAGYLLMR